MKKPRDEAQRLYDYLLAHHLGAKNATTKENLALGTSLTKRQLRYLTQEINESQEFERLISTADGCYMCETKEECCRAIKSTYRQAITLFKKAHKMEKKVGLNGQIKIEGGEIVETFTETAK